MKKFIVLVAAALLLGSLVVVAGCGGSEDSQPVTSCVATHTA